jgi:metal-dependent hydrolase (beta-lactamase superfamily II)
MSTFVRKLIFGLMGFVAVASVIAVGALEWRFRAGREDVDREWAQAAMTPLIDVGTTRTLEILPLVDWTTADPRLEGEAGIAYLIRTDHNTILFDVGLNAERRDPSPLLANMQRLGISLGDVDTLVLSHAHLDHVGGLRWLRRGTFSLGNDQLDLRGKRIFVPVDVTYPGVTPIISHRPTVIGPGVATTGAIAGQLYMGRVDEQALAIRVQGQGVVLVVGCGHQDLSRILARSAELFEEPLYGLLGGLHYPVPHGRVTTVGIDLQRLFVFGPFRGPTAADVSRNIGLLAARNPAWVSLSSHDSSDDSVNAFRTAFGARYHDLKVGEWLQVASRAQAVAEVRAQPPRIDVELHGINLR